MRTLANSPEVSLIALRVLAQTEGASASIGADQALPEQETSGFGITVSSVTTEAVVAGVATSEEGCALIGGRAIPSAPATKMVEVFELKPK